MTKNKTSRQGGFTLIEMSVVLIIIGLIVVGVLQGQVLIDNARVRATVQQLQEFDTAANAFQEKFNCIPGDCNKTTTFEIAPPSIANQLVAATHDGNGNGLIEGNRTGDTDQSKNDAFDEENKMFWINLSGAKLVGGSFTDLDATNATGAAPKTHFPESKLRRDGMGVFTLNGRNHYAVGLSNGFDWGPGAAPSQASGIDVKMDDGKPNTGVVLAIGRPSPTIAEVGRFIDEGNLDNDDLELITNANVGPTGDCLIGIDADNSGDNEDYEYNLTNDDNVCPIRVQASF